MFYITTPIPYVNGNPHLGHLYEHVFNDVIARFRSRVESQTVFYQVGADQHGLKILQKANELEVDPKDYVAQKAIQFKQLWEEYEIGYDTFVETESDNHKIVAQTIFAKLLEKEFIYKKSYEGLYCVGCEDFYAPSQLTEDGKCPIHDKEPIKMNEENYFFKLSHFTDHIKKYLEESNIQPNSQKQEWSNFISEGLQDISVSREKNRLPWGIDIKIDNQKSDQVMYVWFEALLNYLTALVNPETLDKYKEFPNQAKQNIELILEDIETSLPIDFMFLGKDIAKFHLVVWIGILSALDLPLPKHAFVHGFINDSQGRKFSKSLGNGIEPQDLKDKFGVDGTRFVMLHEINCQSDTNFDWNRSIESYNSNLADKVGNAVMRVSTLVEKYLDGRLDLYQADNPDMNEYQMNIDLRGVYKELENYNPQKAMQNLFAESAKINQYLENTKPWSLAKDMENNREKLKYILTQAAIALSEVGKALSIFLPQSGQDIVEIFTQEKVTKANVLFQKIELVE